MLDGIENDEDSLQNYSDNLDDKQKRYIDSLKIMRGLNNGLGKNPANNSYYKQGSQRNSDEKDFQRSSEMIRMLNNQAGGNPNNNISTSENQFGSNKKQKKPIQSKC